MNTDSKRKTDRKHVGHNLRIIRAYMGIKQDALAVDLGISQQEISKIERQTVIEEKLLIKVADVLGIPTEAIKDFDVEKTIDNINKSEERTISAEKTVCTCKAPEQINLIDKIVELYKRLLRSEREKIELLKSK